jgi:anti-sigma factor RsiW
MTMFETVENWALHAFADGELEGEDKNAVEKLLLENEEARKALSAINYQRSELHKAFDDTLAEPIPASLLAAAHGRPSMRVLPYLVAACAVGLFLIGGSVGWFAGQNNLNSAQILTASLAQRALTAHANYSAEPRHAVEVSASDKDHLQAWLSKRVGSDFKIPDLQSNGYTLLGGRLLAESNAPAGQLMYENADKQRMTIFFSANTDGQLTDLKLEQKDKLVTCFWRDAKLAMAITADISNDQMKVLGSSIFTQVEGKHGVYER